MVAAVILYIPANVYPVMTIISFGSGFPSTILEGVEELLTGGMWPLALLVFFASITVPVLKLISLIYLMLSIKFKSRGRLRDRTRMYRIVDAVGRWSMIDVFMVSILVALCVPAPSRPSSPAWAPPPSARRRHHHDGGHELRSPADVGCGGRER